MAGSAIAASIVFSDLNTATHALFRREVERKLSNNVASCTGDWLPAIAVRLLHQI